MRLAWQATRDREVSNSAGSNSQISEQQYQFPQNPQRYQQPHTRNLRPQQQTPQGQSSMTPNDTRQSTGTPHPRQTNHQSHTQRSSTTQQQGTRQNHQAQAKKHQRHPNKPVGTKEKLERLAKGEVLDDKPKVDTLAGPGLAGSQYTDKNLGRKGGRLPLAQALPKRLMEDVPEFPIRPDTHMKDDLIMRPKKFFGLYPDECQCACYGIYWADRADQVCPFKEKPGRCPNNHNVKQEVFDFIVEHERITWAQAKHMIDAWNRNKPADAEFELIYPPQPGRKKLVPDTSGTTAPPILPRPSAWGNFGKIISQDDKAVFRQKQEEIAAVGDFRPGINETFQKQGDKSATGKTQTTYEPLHEVVRSTGPTMPVMGNQTQPPPTASTPETPSAQIQAGIASLKLSTEMLTPPESRLEKSQEATATYHLDHEEVPSGSRFYPITRGSDVALDEEGSIVDDLLDLVSD